MHSTYDRDTHQLVLLAEMDDEVRGQLAGCLTHDGYRVIEVEDGYELLDYLELSELFPGKIERPAVIVSDADLAGVGGIEACRLVGYHRPAPPFVLLAQLGDQATFRDALNAGVTEVIDKPISIDEVRDVVAHLMFATRPGHLSA